MSSLDALLGYAESISRVVPEAIDSGRTWASNVFLGSVATSELSAATGFRGLNLVAKPLILPSLTAHSLLRSRGWAPGGTGLFAAMGAFHAAGDIVLLRETDKGRFESLTPGAIAFAAGHVAGIALYESRSVRWNPRATAINVALGVGVGLGLSAMAKKVTIHQLVQGAYAAFLLEYVSRGVSTVGRDDWDTDSARTIAVGSVVWAVSDALIAVRLATRDGSFMRRVLSVAVMDLYGSGQLLTQSGLVRALNARR